jgi:choline dehydrogenase-like flavoprotein
VIADARDLAPGAAIHCDMCVIGGGAAGVTAFLELARRGRDVVLLEGGGIRREALAQGTYREDVLSAGPTSEVVGAGGSHPPLESTREKKLGGTSSWGGRCAPLDRIDFDAGGGGPDRGWPISLEDLAPFYERANRWVEAGDFQYTSAGSGLDPSAFVLGGAVDAEIDDSKLYRFSPPTHFGKRYKRALEQSTSRVYFHANVLRLELAPDGEAVLSVFGASLPGRPFRVLADSFIVAAGGLESTRILLASGRAAGRPVGTGHDLVGHCYMTHLDAIVGDVDFTARAPLPAYSYELSRDGVYCRRLVSVRESLQHERGLLNMAAAFFMPLPKDPSHGDSLLSAYALTKEVLYRARLGFKSRRYGRYGLHDEPVRTAAHAANIVRNPGKVAKFGSTWVTRRSLARRKLPSFLSEVASGNYRIHFNAEQSPSQANRVTLGDSMDEFGVPRLRVRWHVAESDYESIGRSLSVVAQALERLGVAQVRVPGNARELFEAMGGGFLAGTHAMGTTRMGSSPRTSVVDTDCRVHGVRNLYIASSSVFPTGGFAPPTLTIVALAVRVADVVQRAARPLYVHS